MPKLLIEHPLLYARTKTGNIKWYSLIVKHKKGVSEIHRIKASKIGGKTQTDIDEITEGVNIGKTNETTRPNQAEFYAVSMMNKLRDQGYKSFEDLGIISAPCPEGIKYVQKDREWFDLEDCLNALLPLTNTDASDNVKPMLAKAYAADKVDYIAFAQPKFDGVRCLALRTDEAVELYSRTGKRYYATQIEEDLMKVMAVGDIFDGELYSHGEIDFQDIISAVKDRKETNILIDKIKYFVYDIAIADMEFEKRWFTLCEKMRSSKLELVLLSPILSVFNEKQIVEAHDRWVEEGYEGLMIRNKKGMYEFANRSQDLMKYKIMMDAEWIICDVLEATGRDKGTAIFVCSITLHDGTEDTFKARPEGSKEVRTNYWLARKTLIGLPLTVQYQGLSRVGKPRFPVGKAIRDYE